MAEQTNNPYLPVARATPVVSDGNRQVLVGTAFTMEDGDILIVVNSERWKEEVGAFFEMDNSVRFMLGCQFIPAQKYQSLDSISMRTRKYLIDFSNNPRVLIDSPENSNDGRTGRVYEINKHNAKIRVAFESGPGNVVDWFERHELQIIRDGVDIRVVDDAQ